MRDLLNFKVESPLLRFPISLWYSPVAVLVLVVSWKVEGGDFKTLLALGEKSETGTDADERSLEKFSWKFGLASVSLRVVESNQVVGTCPFFATRRTLTVQKRTRFNQSLPIFLFPLHSPMSDDSLCFREKRRESWVEE